MNEEYIGPHEMLKLKRLALIKQNPKSRNLLPGEMPYEYYKRRNLKDGKYAPIRHWGTYLEDVEYYFLRLKPHLNLVHEELLLKYFNIDYKTHDNISPYKRNDTFLKIINHYLYWKS